MITNTRQADTGVSTHIQNNLLINTQMLTITYLQEHTRITYNTLKHTSTIPQRDTHEIQIISCSVRSKLVHSIYLHRLYPSTRKHITHAHKKKHTYTQKKHTHT